MIGTFLVIKVAEWRSAALLKYNFLFIALILPTTILYKYLKRIYKFDIDGKLRPYGMLKWKVFWKKEELKLEKDKDKNF